MQVPTSPVGAGRIAQLPRRVARGPMSHSPVTLFVCGDVMTGRGIDQILPRPSAPQLHEPFAHSALDYLALAERAHGAIPRSVPPGYVWGDALDELARRAPGVRVINLETSITTSEEADPKGINYRMHPANVAVLDAAGIKCATLANNHVLDWGRAGLIETLDTLDRAGIRHAGAGRTAAEAGMPAVLPIPGGRVLVWAVGGPDCGIGPGWAAAGARPGVARLPDYGPASVHRLTRAIDGVRRATDVVVLSVHWGGNWGFDVPDAHRRFAHAVIDGGQVDLVVGHSSHHLKAIEIYRGRPILYGCGDFLNDYEGIGAHDGLPSDLALMYFVTIIPDTHALASLELVPMVIRRFRLGRAVGGDRAWLRDTIVRECGHFGLTVSERAEALVVEQR